MAPRRNENVMAATINAWTQHCAGPSCRSTPNQNPTTHTPRAREVQGVECPNFLNDSSKSY
jgi:hypothetical protein